MAGNSYLTERRGGEKKKARRSIVYSLGRPGKPREEGARSLANKGEKKKTVHSLAGVLAGGEGEGEKMSRGEKKKRGSSSIL